MAVLKIECLPVLLVFILFIDLEGNGNRVKIHLVRSSATCFEEPLNVEYPNPKIDAVRDRMGQLVVSPPLRRVAVECWG